MKRTISLILVLAAIISTNLLSAQDSKNKTTLPGSWLGKLSTNGIDLRLVFNLKLNEKDSLICNYG